MIGFFIFTYRNMMSTGHPFRTPSQDFAKAVKGVIQLRAETEAYFQKTIGLSPDAREFENIRTQTGTWSCIVGYINKNHEFLDPVDLRYNILSDIERIEKLGLGYPDQECNIFGFDIHEDSYSWLEAEARNSVFMPLCVFEDYVPSRLYYFKEIRHLVPNAVKDVASMIDDESIDLEDFNENVAIYKFTTSDSKADIIGPYLDYFTLEKFYRFNSDKLLKLRDQSPVGIDMYAGCYNFNDFISKSNELSIKHRSKYGQKMNANSHTKHIEDTTWIKDGSVLDRLSMFS